MIHIFTVHPRKDIYFEKNLHFRPGTAVVAGKGAVVEEVEAAEAEAEEIKPELQSSPSDCSGRVSFSFINFMSVDCIPMILAGT